jgi:hypothetical protein
VDLYFGCWPPEQKFVLQCYRTMAPDWLQQLCGNILWQDRSSAMAADPIPLAAVVKCWITVLFKKNSRPLTSGQNRHVLLGGTVLNLCIWPL